MSKNYTHVFIFSFFKKKKAIYLYLYIGRSFFLSGFLTK